MEFSWEGGDGADGTPLMGRDSAILQGTNSTACSSSTRATTPSLMRIGLNQRRRSERGRRGETQARQGQAEGDIVKAFQAKRAVYPCLPIPPIL